MLKQENLNDVSPSRKEVAHFNLYDIVQSLTTIEYEDDKPIMDFFQQITLIRWLFEDIMYCYEDEKECELGDREVSIVKAVDNLFYNDLLDYFTIEDLEKYLEYKKEIEEDRNNGKEED